MRRRAGDCFSPHWSNSQGQGQGERARRRTAAALRQVAIARRMKVMERTSYHVYLDKIMKSVVLKLEFITF